MTKLAANIREYREAFRMTQLELSKRLSIGQNLVSRFESGAKIPSLTMLIHIADIFGLSLDVLVGRQTPGDWKRDYFVRREYLPDKKVG